jgi:hypothetical protein
MVRQAALKMNTIDGQFALGKLCSRTSGYGGWTNFAQDLVIDFSVRLYKLARPILHARIVIEQSGTEPSRRLGAMP